MSATTGDIDDLNKNLTLVVGIVGGVLAVLIAVAIIIVLIVCSKATSLKKQLDIIQSSLRSVEKDMSKTQVVLDRFPKNIVQFPITKSAVIDDDDRSGTEPASPIFFRKGYSQTPLASSLISVTEVPNEHQVAHHPLHRNNAMPMPHVRTKQQGPPVPPKRAQSFNNHSFINY